MRFQDSIEMRAKIFGLLGDSPKEEIQTAKDRRKDFIERVMKDENI